MEPYKKYAFKPYDPMYPKLFKKEGSKLKKILAKSARIEHVGSTAVPGLGGKGIIDIVVFVNKKQISPSLSLLLGNNFEYNPNHPGNEQRLFLQKRTLYRGKERRVHIHLTANKKFFHSFIVFRDFLRAHPKARDEYAKIKKEGSEIAKGDRLKYAEHKSAALKKILNAALNEEK